MDLRVETSSYAGEIQAAFRGFDTVLFLRSLLAGLLIGNENVDVWAKVRNDNPIVVEHVR